ncbi:hypothetical protein HELRODRAFT_134081, partial [Helobdella robusta]|uniref:Tubulin--tyrosine ligase-like protein 9 n=1 Tax=Helobdella robusta TaxID=6412 RepID=T1EI33_HELRO
PRSIHLSNNSVQKQYQPSVCRSKMLPVDNMWTCEEFKSYLSNLPDPWANIIVPGMKKGILNALLCTQDLIDHRKNSFELFGADFMLLEDFTPWLIEINSSPSMARTTTATAYLVEKVLEDTIKVVIDRHQNKSCDTGKFELAYRQPQV